MKTLSWSAVIALLCVALCASSASAQTETPTPTETATPTTTTTPTPTVTTTPTPCPSPPAESLKCRQAIAKQSAKFVQTKVKILSKCEAGAIKNNTPGSCPDTKATTSIDKAAAKMRTAIGKTCGGSDQVCGGDLSGEFTPAALCWPATCPSFEHLSEFDEQPINDCGDIVSCLTGIDDTVVDQSIKLSYDALNLGNSSLVKCQTAIGKAAAAFMTSKSKALQKCWDAKLKGKLDPAATCLDPNPGDGKYLAAIAKAEAKLASTICKACGGADKDCGGAADLTPSAIGFVPDCPAVTVPGGPACGGAISDLTDIVACLACVNEFKVDCADRLQVPQFATYPTECEVCTAPAPTGACPTSLVFTADGPNVDLDAGWTGLGHDATVPTNGRITLAVSCGPSANQPTCGQCNVSGPLENTGGPEFDTRRCSDAPWVHCSSDADCTAATQCLGGTNNGALCTSNPECPGSNCSGGTNNGALCTTGSECPGGTCDAATCANAGHVGPCTFFFGAPLPLRTGGVSTCIVNRIAGSVTGTINIDDGTSTTNVPLQSIVHPTGTEFAPCPRCESDTCQDGPRLGQACIVNGTGLFGDVSLDCPPNPGSAAGTLGINLNIATGTQQKTVSVDNPTCRQTGYTGLKCLCDTCNTANQEACSTNSDCPISGGNPGICGGRRCIGGTNNGAPCTNTSACPGGGQCNRPGEATQPSACLDDTSTPTLGCVDAGNNEGVCADGPAEQVCSIQTFRSCSTDADCAPSVTCADCLPEQTCIARNRECFVDNGIVGNSVTVSGKPDVPCNGIAKPTVGTFFCIAPVGASAVNAAGGLPGLGRTRIPSETILTPWN